MWTSDNYEENSTPHFTQNLDLVALTSRAARKRQYRELLKQDPERYRKFLEKHRQYCRKNYYKSKLQRQRQYDVWVTLNERGSIVLDLVSELFNPIWTSGNTDARDLYRFSSRVQMDRTLSKSEQNRRYKQRLKQDPVRYRKYLEKHRQHCQKYVAKKSQHKLDWTFS